MKGPWREMFPGCCGAYVLHGFGDGEHLTLEELQRRMEGHCYGEKPERAILMVALVEGSTREADGAQLWRQDVAIDLCLRAGFKPVMRWGGQHGEYTTVLMAKGDYKLLGVEAYKEWELGCGEDAKRG